MTGVRLEAPPARCPGCGEERLVEWDATLRRFVCAVCSRTWPGPPATVGRVFRA